MASIGKNIIDIITFNLYDSPKDIFREYIQNSADAIDAAVGKKILNSNSEGHISIILDKDERLITIEDNGIGVSVLDIRKKLVDVANSQKNRTTDKGFYGIGRLTGLGFCDKIIFETSVRGELVKSVIEMDASLAHEIIYDNNNHSDAIQVIDKMTKVTSDTVEDVDKHYFIVKLIGVRNVSNDELLDIEAVRDYLRMVAPVPYDRTFQYFYNHKISPYVQEKNLKLDVYDIYLGNGYQTPDKLTKCYNTSIYDKNGRKIIDDEVKDLKFMEFHNDKKELLAWGWYSISNFNGIITDCYQNRARGIRFRKHNIQIGDEETFVKNKFHKEPRGNKYFFGEIHIVHKDLVPNTQRNDFTQNETYQQFKQKLKTYLLSLHGYYQEASKIRSAFEAIKKAETLRGNFEITKPISSDDREMRIAEIKKADIEAQKKSKEIERRKTQQNDDVKCQLFNNISSLYKATKNYAPKTKKTDAIFKDKSFLFDDLSQLNKNERKLVSKVFKVIVDSIPDKKLIESLAIKIKESFK